MLVVIVRGAAAFDSLAFPMDYKVNLYKIPHEGVPSFFSFYREGR